MIRHINITPFRIRTSLHKPNSWNTIDNTAVVSMVPFHAQQFWVFEPSRFAFKIFPVTDLNRVFGIQSHNHTIFDIDCWDPILCSSHNIRIVKPHLIGPRFYGLIPVYIARSQTQMPFAHNASVIAFTFKHFRQCNLSSIND